MELYSMRERPSHFKIYRDASFLSKCSEAGVGGQIRVYGAPAEEGGSGKTYLARSGELDDVDIVLHWHPSAANSASQGASLSNVSTKFRYHGQSAHAALAPDKGRSALDALEATTFTLAF